MKAIKYQSLYIITFDPLTITINIVFDFVYHEHLWTSSTLFCCIFTICIYIHFLNNCW